MSGQRKKSSFDQPTAASLMKTSNTASNNQSKKLQGQSSQQNAPISPTETKSLPLSVVKEKLVSSTKARSLPPSLSTTKGQSSPTIKTIKGGSASSSPSTPSSPKSLVIKSPTGKSSKKKPEQPVKQTTETREPIHPVEITNLVTSASLNEGLHDIHTRSLLASMDGSDAFSNERVSVKFKIFKLLLESIIYSLFIDFSKVEPVTMIENQTFTSRNNESLIENSVHSKSNEENRSPFGKIDF